MRTLSRTLQAAAWAALLALTPSVLLAQGTSPWVEAVNELQAQFTGPIATRAVADRDRGGRADVRVRRGR